MVMMMTSDDGGVKLSAVPGQLTGFPTGTTDSARLGPNQGQTAGTKEGVKPGAVLGSFQGTKEGTTKGLTKGGNPGSSMGQMLRPNNDPMTGRFLRVRVDVDLCGFGQKFGSHAFLFNKNVQIGPDFGPNPQTNPVPIWIRTKMIAFLNTIVDSNLIFNKI